jgi:DNA polymerase III sliding clamp (beta) subunit (PCNA family)
LKNEEVCRMVSTDFGFIQEKTTTIRINIRELAEGISKVFSAMGKKDDYYSSLNGVFLNPLKNEIVATDNKRMHIISLPMRVEGSLEGLLIHPDLIKPIMLLGKKLDQEVEITVKSKSDKHKLVELKGNQFRILFDDTLSYGFPVYYEKAIPTNSPIKWIVEKETLKKTLEMMHSFSSQDAFVRATITKDGTNITAKKIRDGIEEKLEKNISSTLEGCDQFKFEFQSPFVLDIISALRGGCITFEMKDNENAVLVKEENFIGVFMPGRMNEDE